MPPEILKQNKKLDQKNTNICCLEISGKILTKKVGKNLDDFGQEK